MFPQRNYVSPSHINTSWQTPILDARAMPHRTASPFPADNQPVNQPAYNTLPARNQTARFLQISGAQFTDLEAIARKKDLRQFMTFLTDAIYCHGHHYSETLHSDLFARHQPRISQAEKDNKIAAHLSPYYDAYNDFIHHNPDLFLSLSDTQRLPDAEQRFHREFGKFLSKKMNNSWQEEHAELNRYGRYIGARLSETAPEEVENAIAMARRHFSMANNLPSSQVGKKIEGMKHAIYCLSYYTSVSYAHGKKWKDDNGNKLASKAARSLQAMVKHLENEISEGRISRGQLGDLSGIRRRLDSAEFHQRKYYSRRFPFVKSGPGDAFKSLTGLSRLL